MSDNDRWPHEREDTYALTLLEDLPPEDSILWVKEWRSDIPEMEELELEELQSHSGYLLG